jgi:hypothetical protein
MKYKVEVYYKGGGTAIYPIFAPNMTIAKNYGRAISTRWEPNLPIVKVLAKKVPTPNVKLYAHNPDKPFGDPFDDTEDLSTHPRSKWYV